MVELSLLAVLVAWAAVAVLAMLKPGVGLGLAILLGRYEFPTRGDGLFPGVVLVLFCVAVGLLVRHSSFQRSRGAQLVAIYCAALAAAGAISLLLNPDVERFGYGTSKVLFIAAVILPMVVFAAAFSQRDREDFALTIAIYPLAAGLAGILLGSFTSANRLSAVGGGPIVLAQEVSVAILYFAFRPYKSWVVRLVGGWWMRLLIPVLLIILVLTDSRGPVVALAVVVVIGAVLRAGASPRRMVTTAVAIAAAAAAALELARRGFVPRWDRLLTNGWDELQRARVVLWEVGLDESLSAGLFGGAPGSFDQKGAVPLTASGFENRYAHNIVLEVLSEFGLLAGLFGLCLLVMVAPRIARGMRSDSAEQRFWAHAAAFAFMAAQFSGDVYNNRFFFVYLAMFLVVSTPSGRSLPARGPSLQTAR